MIYNKIPYIKHLFLALSLGSMAPLLANGFDLQKQIIELKDKNSTEPIIAYIEQHPQDVQILLDLLTTNNGTPFYQHLVQKTSWPQLERFAKWVHNIPVAKIPSTHYLPYINFISEKYIANDELLGQLLVCLDSCASYEIEAVNAKLMMNISSLSAAMQQSVVQWLLERPVFVFHTIKTDPFLDFFLSTAGEEAKNLFIEGILKLTKTFPSEAEYIYEKLFLHYYHLPAQQKIALVKILEANPKLLIQPNVDNFISSLDHELQNRLKDLYRQHHLNDIKPSLTRLLELQQKIPSWAFSTEFGQDFNNKKLTQSKPHFFRNITATLQLLYNCPSSVRQTVLKMYRKEQEERAKGRYIFYHAQAWNRHFSADLYKGLWNIVHHDTVGEDFTFLRFNQQKKISDARQDSLFMNHALFGNSTNNGNCSLSYFKNSSSCYSGDVYDAQQILNTFKLGHLYTKYQTEFEELRKLHNAATQHGNMLLISIAEKDLHRLHPTIEDGTLAPVEIEGKKTSDMKLILNTLITNPTLIQQHGHPHYGSHHRTNDELEYAMPLTTAYALNPHGGLHIYEFNAALPEKYQAYLQARDSLFAKIRKALKS